MILSSIENFTSHLREPLQEEIRFFISITRINLYPIEDLSQQIHCLGMVHWTNNLLKVIVLNEDPCKQSVKALCCNLNYPS